MPAEEIPFERLEALINEISMGGRLVDIKDQKGHPRLVFLTHCVGYDKVLADYEYKKAYESALKEGFLTSAETRSLLLSKGVVEEVDEEEVEKMRGKIEGQEAYIYKLSRVPSRKQVAIENLNRMKKELNELLYKKEVGLDFSAERIANERMYLYITWRCSLDPDTRERIWLNKSDFDDDGDLIFRRNLFLETIRVSGGEDVGTLRYLARSNIWRIRYIAATKTGGSLFGRTIPEYTVDQLALVYWSNFYQSVYEMMPDDRPPESIVEDDAALDAYMKSYMEEMHREAISSREKKQKGKGVKSAWDHGETLVMRSNPLYGDVEYSETIESVRNKNKTDIRPKKPGSK